MIVNHKHTNEYNFFQNVGMVRILNYVKKYFHSVYLRIIYYTNICKDNSLYLFVYD